LHYLRAVYLVRDLVNLPASHLGPQELADAATAVFEPLDAKITITRGAPLAKQYPAVHAVGTGSERPPLFMEINWGNAKHPRIAIVGKGVVFDTGGYDIKPSSNMLLMKKDMGGAAHAIGLGYLIITSKLPVQLQILLPIVENSISGHAMRPSDVINTRKGLTVEIGNTDAEGRLILADALTRADEGNPEVIIDFATLTGAARAALGPDLPAFFCTDDRIARQIMDLSMNAYDPVWQLPLWQGYMDQMKGKVADINNTGRDSFAGAIYAALFLQKFVSPKRLWMHLDTFAWNASARPGRPDGGEALGLRTIYAWLRGKYGR
ncbi:MAG TPA: leucyl aminopeptidase family protein, partial [Alphaproteobacteria bacterium]|nr:leucyl aminopeptidase family protein [Alphaproteobacteria bacterium]